MSDLTRVRPRRARIWLIGALPVAMLLGSAAGDAGAAPASMTRTAIINLGKTVVGYSYWWGHGRWRTDGAQHGSCKGSCPSCSPSWSVPHRRPPSSW